MSNKKKDNNIAIVLDTNTFGKINKYNFNMSIVSMCLSSLKNYSNINVFISSVVYDEIKKHIKETIDNLIHTIKNSFLIQYNDFNNIDTLYERKVKELDDFIKRYDIKVIDCNEYCCLKDINEWYFSCTKPFSQKKPKEFPDAMIVSSVINYFKDDTFNKVVMISKDDDVISAIKEKTCFEVIETISDVMSEFVGISDKQLSNCLKYINDVQVLNDVDTYSIYSYDPYDSIEIGTIKSKVKEVEVIDSDEDRKYYQLYLTCDLDLYGEFRIVDQNLSVYDREDPNCSVYWFREGEHLFLENVGVFVCVYYDENNKFVKYEVVKIEEILINNYIDQLELID